ncbi:signal recognition particle-docking protein FtsY [Salinirubellus salinus]|jgi:fused signal recognition particle receptor|uniref:Signal recognition particle receptor FtsY n=1 Tax=Salinirubellus salinus TaxID=1364945 RepID=A0A9E7QZW0_9EURY|nr:signal recognition particle-docking protein FtsY [Salinirubellus salinus]UWM53105.1 signal recognition particle-docking protein FtsY [Salinirubellus salinus]
MFDGLKEKLGRFRDDVEEEAAEAEAEAEPEEADAATETAETEADAEPVAESESESESRSTTAETAPSRDADSGTAADAEPEEPDRGGLASRARRFATGKTLITAEELEEPLEQLEFALLQGDVEMSVAAEITERLREQLVGQERAQVKSGAIVIQEAIGEALKEVISVGQFDFEQRIAEAEKPVTLVFTGVNGVGKTTTIAKLARRFEDQGYSVVMANGDTYRAGANEQIQEHADALGTKLISHQQGGDPAAVLYDAVEYANANDVDIVLGDTAGRLHTAKDLMAQLEKIDRVVDPDMTLFVDEAVAGQDATQRAKQFNDAAEIDGVVLTKADADSQGGAAVSIAHVTGKPILFLGVGQAYDDLERFDPEVIVSRLTEDE